MKQRPAGITALAVLSALSALLGLAMCIAALALSFDMFDVAISLGSFGIVTALVFGLSAALSAAQAWGLWKLRSWARTLTIIFSAIGLLAFPVGTLVSAIILWYLFQPSVKVVFGVDETSDKEDEESGPRNGGTSRLEDPDSYRDQGGSSDLLVFPEKANAWLVNDDGGDNYQINKGDTRLGRGSGSDVILPDPAISREQALIREQNGSCTLYDRASTYGTIVNGQRVAGPVLLRHGDVIRMGDTSLRLVCQE